MKSDPMKKYKYNHMKLVLRKPDASDFTEEESLRLVDSFMLWADGLGLAATGAEHERFDDDWGVN